MRVAMQASHDEDKSASMARQMGQWVDQVLGQGFHKYRPEETWSPMLNLYEDETHYCVVVDLAGVKAEEIELHPETDTLVLSGYRPTPGISDASGNVRLHHMEIDHGPFSRTMELPDDVMSQEVEASYRQGFLWIRIPKAK